MQHDEQPLPARADDEAQPGAAGEDEDDLTLPPEVEERLRHVKRYGGVSFSIDWNKESGRRGHVTAIHWRSGEVENELVKYLLEDVVEEEMPLIIDGEPFVIRKGKLT